MFKHMKVGSKIVGLAVILIILTGFVAFVGYHSLSGVVNSVARVNDVNGLVQDLLAIRQQEKDFVILGDPLYADKVRERIGKLKKDITVFKTRFDRKENKEAMDLVARQLSAYGAAFDVYDELESSKNKTMVEMQDNTRAAMEKLEDIEADQEKQLAESRKALETFLNRSLAIVDDANLVVKYVLEARLAEKDYLLTGDKKAFERSIDTINAVFDITDRMLPRLSQDGDKKIVQKMGDQTTGYVLAFSNYLNEKNDFNLKSMLQYANDMQQAAVTIRKKQREKLVAVRAESSIQNEIRFKRADDANRMVKWFLETRKNEKDMIITQDRQYRAMVNEQIARIIKLGQDLKAQFKSEASIRKIDEALSSVMAYKAAFDRFAGLMDKQIVADKKMVSVARSVQDACEGIQSNQQQTMLGRIARANQFMIGGAVISMFFGLLLCFFITRSIQRGIAPVVEGLTDAADQVSIGSHEIASSSQTLAAGASQQAAGIEEISSSLEEMSSMTKQSAENAGQADAHMQESRQVVVNANDSMVRLTNAMGEISEASIETSKIIKTIDEIAFQTNLLALNAAVEAARAGEAGSGFAVVADEVRNLSMRAAEAAKDTSRLIDSVVKKIHEGTELVDQTSHAFHEVAGGTEKISVLVSEIASASHEQKKGIEQVDIAISEMNEVTQQNAANAEESASASEEMNAQAERMEKFVRDLTLMIGNLTKAGDRRFSRKRNKKKVVPGRNAASSPVKRIEAPPA